MLRLLTRTLMLFVVFMSLWALSAGLGRLFPSGVVALDSNRNANYDIYLLDVRSRLLHRVMRNPAQDRNPTWSPDGRFLAFESIRQEDASPIGTAIYVIDLFRDPTDAKRITPDYIRGTQAAWSPDGRYIAFTGAEQGAFNNDLYLVREEDRLVVRLTDTPAASELDPQWSPDGRFISYSVFNRSVGMSTDVEALEFFDSPLRLIQFRSESFRISDRTNASDPSWTPNSRVLFQYGAPFGQLYVGGFRRGDDQPLNPDMGRFMEMPRMSPDGEWVIYSGADNRNTGWRSLFIVPTDGGEPRQLTFGTQRNNYRDGSPEWMPTGPTPSRSIPQLPNTTNQ